MDFDKPKVYGDTFISDGLVIITAGIAVLLTIITYFSTPILTKIFGDGSLEVRELLKLQRTFLISF